MAVGILLATFYVVIDDLFAFANVVGNMYVELFSTLSGIENKWRALKFVNGYRKFLRKIILFQMTYTVHGGLMGEPWRPTFDFKASLSFKLTEWRGWDS